MRHDVLIALGATSVSNENGITKYKPTNLNLSNYNSVLLSITKAKKYIEISQDRDSAISTPVIVHGRPWQVDKASVDNLTQEILTVQAGLPMSPVWRDANNSNMALTSLSDLVAIAAALKEQKLLAYQQSWARKTALDAATTIEEVNLV